MTPDRARFPIAVSGTEFEEGEGIGPLADTARALGVDRVELWHPRNTAREGVDAARARLLTAGLSVACVSTGSELYRNGGSRGDQALLLEGVELAARCGAPVANTYFGWAAVRDDEKAIETYTRLLSPCLARAEALGVTIVLENEFDAFGHDGARSDVTRRPEALRRLVERVGSPSFRLNFDAANFLCANVDPLAAFDALAPFVAYVHVKDVRGVAQDAPSAGYKRYRDEDRLYETTPLGEGAVDWPTLLSRLAADGYAGALTLEPHAEADRRAAGFAQAAAALRRLVVEAVRGSAAPGAALAGAARA